MNEYQKRARFTLIMLGLAFGLSIIAMLVLRFAVGISWQRSTAGFAFIGIMGFSRISPSLFKRDISGLDERDLIIKQRAMISAYWTFWPLFVLAAMAPMFIYGPNGVVSVRYLCWMVFGGMLPRPLAKLAERYSKELPKSKVIGINSFKISKELLRVPKTSAEISTQYLNIGKLFTQKSIEILTKMPFIPNQHAFYGFTNGSLEIIKFFKR